MYNIKIWIEKTIVERRPDRENGEWTLGKALWSPLKSKDGADIYKNMRLVEKGDIVLHLINNKVFSGVSIVKSSATESKGIDGTNWSGPVYLIELNDYIPLTPPINRNLILSQKNKNLLNQIAKTSEVYYNSKLDLRQGAYLTPCPIKLLRLINDVYKQYSATDLPHIEHIDLGNSEESLMNTFGIYPLIDSLKKAGLKISNEIVARFTASLLTKPFVILTGLSGSGKTKLAQAFAMWICEDENQYCIVPVGADWTNREPLLGFPNALEREKYVKPDNRVLDLIIEANKNENKPYFLILDEMNLSHVERYFADFLSVMESKEYISLHSGTSEWNGVPAKIGLPKNLFIIGTVNIDETTYMFSPKVLDRANVIEFRVTAKEMGDYLQSNTVINLEYLKSEGKDMAESFVQLAEDNHEIEKVEDRTIITDSLNNFFAELKKCGAEFGYRSASEIIRFAAVVNKLDDNWKQDEITDAAIMQKLLPKVHGSRRKIIDPLGILASFCLKSKEGVIISAEDKIKSVQSYISDSKLNETLEIIYPISFEKIIRMIKNAIINGFTSYAEA